MSTDDLSAPPSRCADLDPLVTFLLARLDDDETAARGHMRGGGILPFESIGQAADHSARHGPLRVLREVAAKRSMVQMWLSRSRTERDRTGAGRPDVATAMVVAMAAVYAEHADFDPSWLGALETARSRVIPGRPARHRGGARGAPNDATQEGASRTW
jgi:Family of unknown function (DUF6221)